MQSSQSSATTALRAIIMLAFVITIPLVALNGSAMPEKAKKLLDQFWPTITSLLPKTSANVMAEAPAYDIKSQNLQAIPGQLPNSQANPLTQLPANNQPNVLPVQQPGINIGRLSQQSSDVLPASYQSAIDPRINVQANADSSQARCKSVYGHAEPLETIGLHVLSAGNLGQSAAILSFLLPNGSGGEFELYALF